MNWRSFIVDCFCLFLLLLCIWFYLSIKKIFYYFHQIFILTSLMFEYKWNGFSMPLTSVKIQNSAAPRAMVNGSSWLCLFLFPINDNRMEKSQSNFIYKSRDCQHVKTPSTHDRTLIKIVVVQWSKTRQIVWWNFRLSHWVNEFFVQKVPEYWAVEFYINLNLECDEWIIQKFNLINCIAFQYLIIHDFTKISWPDRSDRLW